MFALRLYSLEILEIPFYVDVRQQNQRGGLFRRRVGRLKHLEQYRRNVCMRYNVALNKYVCMCALDKQSNFPGLFFDFFSTMEQGPARRFIRKLNHITRAGPDLTIIFREVGSACICIHFCGRWRLGSSAYLFIGRWVQTTRVFNVTVRETS